MPKEFQLVAFQLGEETYGVDISQVEEIIRLQPITKVPGAPDFVEGVINLRGRVIPVIDLRKRFHLPPREETKNTRIVVVEVPPNTVGMIVDAVDEVLRISEEKIEAPSLIISSIDTEYIKGVGKLENKLLILLDLAKVLTKEEKGALQTMKEEMERKEKKRRRGGKLILSLRGKLLLGFGLLIVLLLVAVGLGYYSINEVNNAFLILSELQDYEEASLEEISAITARIDRIQSTLLLVGLLALAAGLISAFFLYRSILGPILELTRGCEMVEKGDLRQEIEVKSKDEIGKVARSFNSMIQKLRELISQVLRVSSALASSSEELSSSIEEISQATEEIAKTISQVAQGSTEQSTELEAISQETQKISQITHHLSEATQRNLNLIAEMKKGLEKNRLSLYEIEKAMKVTSTEGENSEKEARKGQELLFLLAQNIQEISRVTQEVAQSISTLEVRSQEISKIVDLITGIAEETNLLALNAAIEAARAGEAGRGFAVVASEVRKLAEQSAQAAQQISALIEEVKNDTQMAVERMERAEDRVQEGVKESEEVAKNFQNILATVQKVIQSVSNLGLVFEEAKNSQKITEKSAEEVAALSEDNAQMIQEIDSRIQGVSKSISSVALVSEENAASSQEVSASTEEQSASLEELTSASRFLAQLAQELRDLAATFQV